MRTHWTIQDIAQLDSYLADGLTDKEIATKLGRTLGAVQDKRLRLGMAWGPTHLEPDFKWPEEAVERLKALFLEQKLSYTEIALRLSVEYGHKLTRNTIAGKTSRLGFHRPVQHDTLRIRGERNGSARRKIKYPRLKTGQFAREISAAPPEGVMSFRDIRGGQCRYIAGEVDEWNTLMCGQHTTQGAYCGYHHRLCHTKQRTYPPGAL